MPRRLRAVQDLPVLHQLGFRSLLLLPVDASLVQPQRHHSVQKPHGGIERAADIVNSFVAQTLEHPLHRLPFLVILGDWQRQRGPPGVEVQVDVLFADQGELNLSQHPDDPRKVLRRVEPSWPCS